MDPNPQVIQTECEVQFVFLHYGDLESCEVFDGISILFEVNVSIGVVSNAVEDLV